MVESVKVHRQVLAYRGDTAGLRDALQKDEEEEAGGGRVGSLLMLNGSSYCWCSPKAPKQVQELKLSDWPEQEEKQEGRRKRRGADACAPPLCVPLLSLRNCEDLAQRRRQVKLCGRRS